MDNNNLTNDSIKQKNVNKALCIILAILFGVLCFLGGFFIKEITKSDEVRTVEWLVNYVTKYGYYLDEETGELKKYTSKDFANAIIDGLLDDYSDYYTKQEYNDVINTNKGNKYGLGIGLLKSTDDLRVFSVTGNSPADKANMKSGDVIVAGSTISGDKKGISTRKELTEFTSQFKKGEEFILYCDRDGVEKKFTVKADVFISSFVKYYDSQTYGYFTENQSGTDLEFKTTPSTEMLVLGDDIAYIKFTSFNGKAAFEMDTVMQYVKERKKTKIILDLRDNGGGRMAVLCDVASHFISYSVSNEPVVVRAKDVNGRLTRYSTTSKFNQDIERIAVIANNYSASATECLIGAMLDYMYRFGEKNLVIETGDGATGKTFGKGIMQRTFLSPFTGEAIEITVAEILTPITNKSYHGVGFSTTPANTVGKKYALYRAIETLAD